MICAIHPSESRLQGLALWVNWYLSVDGHEIGWGSFDKEKACNESQGPGIISTCISSCTLKPLVKHKLGHFYIPRI